MSFRLSRRSLDRLEGIDDRLQAVVKMAITLTKTDFGVVQGMRTLEQQKAVSYTHLTLPTILRV